MAAAVYTIDSASTDAVAAAHTPINAAYTADVPTPIDAAFTAAVAAAVPTPFDAAFMLQ